MPSIPNPNNLFLTPEFSFAELKQSESRLDQFVNFESDLHNLSQYIQDGKKNIRVKILLIGKDSVGKRTVIRKAQELEMYQSSQKPAGLEDDEDVIRVKLESGMIVELIVWLCSKVPENKKKLGDMQEILIMNSAQDPDKGDEFNLNPDLKSLMRKRKVVFIVNKVDKFKQSKEERKKKLLKETGKLHEVIFLSGKTGVGVRPLFDQIAQKHYEL